MAPDVQRDVPAAERLVLRSNEAVLSRGQMTHLMDLNLNTGNLNKSAYTLNFGLHGEKFKTSSYDPIAVVWVQIAKNKKALLIRDGHHRAKVVDKHWDEIHQKDATFAPIIRNVTDDYVPVQRQVLAPEQQSQRFRDVIADTPELVIESTIDDWPPALTMREYQHILLEPTIAQKEILSLRVAVSLMMSWGSYVDNETVEKKFPALAALAYLELDDFKYFDPETIQTTLESHNYFFPGNTVKEQQTVREALLAMATDIHDNHVPSTSVLDAAFVVIGAKDEFLDVSDRMTGQLRGLFHHPAVRQKFEREYRGEPPESAVDRLYAAFRDALPQDRFGAEKMGRAMYDALVDPELSLSETREVITTPRRKVQTHTAILKQHTADELEREYLVHVGRTATRGAEAGVITRFAVPDNIGNFRKARIFEDVARYDEVLAGATALLPQLQSPIIGLTEIMRKEFLTELRKKIKMAKQRSGDQLSSSITYLKSYTVTIVSTLEQHAASAAMPIAAESSQTLVEPARLVPDITFLPAVTGRREGIQEQRTGVLAEEGTATTPPNAVTAVTLFLLAKTVSRLTRQIENVTIQEEAEVASVRTENTRLHAENTQLRNSAWWRSPDFTPEEQRLMQAFADNTIKAFMRDEGVDLDEFMRLRRQILEKHQRLMGQ